MGMARQVGGCVFFKGPLRVARELCGVKKNYERRDYTNYTHYIPARYLALLSWAIQNIDYRIKNTFKITGNSQE